MPFDYDFKMPLRSSWNPNKLILRGPLTDKKIKKYEKMGYYDPAFQQARKEMWERRKARRTMRSGNFDLIDGRMVYRPS